MLVVDAAMEERDAREGLVDIARDFVSSLVTERGEDSRCGEEAECGEGGAVENGETMDVEEGSEISYKDWRIMRDRSARDHTSRSESQTS